MPIWVYSDLERWHYLSLLKSTDTIEMLRGIRYHSLEPGKIDGLLHVIQNDLGYYLHRSVQTTKAELSSEQQSLFEFRDGVIDIGASVSRGDFEEWIDEELTSIRGCIQRLLTAANVSQGDIDHVFLTGGSSLTPAVREIFASMFGRGKLTSGSEFTSVAQGLALRALDYR